MSPMHFCGGAWAPETWNNSSTTPELLGPALVRLALDLEPDRIVAGDDLR